jgi:radical SAM superfamily enzyme YgiQ (UPF0313 family)
MKNLDILFIHPPRNYEHLGVNSKKRSAYMLMPMGLVGMADLIEREGFSPKILNYTLERLLDDKFSLLKYLKKTNPGIVGVDLHWVMHSAGAMDTIRFVKQHLPNTFTLLGGFSATWYAKEIMKDYPYVDGIIQSDAEVPIIQLLNNKTSLDKVQNLMYRENGQIKDNGITYVAQEIDSLNFTRIKHIEHWKEFIEKSFKYTRNPFAIEMARGCSFNCIFCGGSKYSQHRMMKRDNVIFRSPGRVVDDIKELLSISPVKTIFYGHGLYPETEPYFMEIQKLLRDEKVDVQAELEVWRLPVSKEFIRDFVKTYDLTRSLLWFSVRNFSASYRKKYTTLLGKFDTSMDFTDAQLKAYVDAGHEFGLINVMFWDTGYPFETWADAFRNNIKALKFVVSNIGNKRRIGMLSEPMLVSPGCPADIFEDKLGLRVRTKTFADQLALNKHQTMKLPPWDIAANYQTKFLSRGQMYVMNKVMWLIYGSSYLPMIFFH